MRYEPRAMVDMQAPPTLRGLWRQRRRWAKGLAQVLRRNAGIWIDWTQRRLYPVYLEAALSILRAYSFVLLTAAWLIAWLLGAPLLGATPIPTLWGMLIATISTPGGLLHSRGEGAWRTPRESETAAERVKPALAPPPALTTKRSPRNGSVPEPWY